jgi:hypothetical protein
MINQDDRDRWESDADTLRNQAQILADESNYFVELAKKARLDLNLDLAYAYITRAQSYNDKALQKIKSAKESLLLSME